jgi:hypothetical protein
VPSDHPDGPARVAAPLEVEPAATRRYCAACSYELSGLAISRCPECGRGFDPADHTTTAGEPARARLRRRERRAVLALLIVLGLVMAVRYTLVPVPNLRFGWRQWIWLSERYGVESYWTGNGFIEVWRWADRAYLVREHAHLSETPLWELRVDDRDQWMFELNSPATEWKSVLSGFNLMKDDMFGVQFEDQSPPAPVQPFEISGSKVDVLSAFVKNFGLRVNTMMIRSDKPYVWVYDRASERLRAMEVPESEQEWFRASSDLAGRELVPPDRELLPYTRPEQEPSSPARAGGRTAPRAPDAQTPADQTGATP